MGSLGSCSESSCEFLRPRSVFPDVGVTSVSSTTRRPYGAKRSLYPDERFVDSGANRATIARATPTKAGRRAGGANDAARSFGERRVDDEAQGSPPAGRHGFESWRRPARKGRRKECSSWWQQNLMNSRNFRISNSDRVSASDRRPVRSLDFWWWAVLKILMVIFRLRTLRGSLKSLFALDRWRIPIFLMTVFAGAVDRIPALQHSRWVFRVNRIERLCRGVVQTMSKGDPSLAVLID
jgi:hypothetical protein